MIENCPSCGSKLEKGYIISDGAAIWWSHKKHKFWAREEKIVPGSGWTLTNVEAYRCTTCKLVLFHYGKE